MGLLEFEAGLLEGGYSTGEDHRLYKESIGEYCWELLRGVLGVLTMAQLEFEVVEAPSFDLSRFVALRGSFPPWVSLGFDVRTCFLLENTLNPEPLSPKPAEFP